MQLLKKMSEAKKKNSFEQRADAKFRTMPNYSEQFFFSSKRQQILSAWGYKT